MMKPHLLIALCLLPLWCMGQNLVLSDDERILQDPFSITGNIGVSFRSYKAWNIENRQYPYTTTLTANAVIKSYAVTIPFNFVMHNLDDSDRPFDKAYWNGFFKNQANRLTRFGASPQYKWIKLHVGHRYMNFGQFTLANHNFLGAGIELSPNRWRISAMVGRLAKAEPQSISLNSSYIIPQQYTRVGWGFKFGYWESNNDLIEISLFSAKDDTASLTSQLDTNFIVTPQENLAISLKAKKSLGKYFTFQFDVAKSALTRNAEDLVYDKGFALYNSFLFKRRSSTSFDNATDVMLEYRKADVSAGISYRRIDPGYKSLGAYFFNDDLENVTAYSGFSILKKKVNLRLEAGVQRNNLEKEKEASFRRIIGSANITYRLNNWDFAANLSNFSSKVDYQLNPELDSLNAVIVSQEANVIVRKIIPGNGASFQSFNFIAGIQSVNDNVDNPDQSIESNLYFTNISYSIATRSSWQYTATIDFNTNINANSMVPGRLNRYGAGMQLAKGIRNNKYQVGVGMNYYLQKNVLDMTTHLWSNFLRGTWQVTKLQALNIQLNWIRNDRSNTASAEKFSELIGSISYNLRFGHVVTRTKPTILN